MQKIQNRKSEHNPKLNELEKQIEDTKINISRLQRKNKELIEAIKEIKNNRTLGCLIEPPPPPPPPRITVFINIEVNKKDENKTCVTENKNKNKNTTRNNLK